MRKFECNENEVKELIDRVVRRTMNMDFTWNWSCGVAYYGICKAWEVTGNQEYIDFLVKWVDEYLELGLPPMMVNACAMGHTMLTLHEATGDSKYLDLALLKAEYLRKDAIRFGKVSSSIRYLPKMIFQSRRGRIRYSWRRISCCGLDLN